MKKIINNTSLVPVTITDLVLENTVAEGSTNPPTTDAVAKAIEAGSGSTYTAGDGISISSDDEISAKVDGTTIGVNASGELEALGGGGSATRWQAVQAGVGGEVTAENNKYTIEVGNKENVSADLLDTGVTNHTTLEIVLADDADEATVDVLVNTSSVSKTVSQLRIKRTSGSWIGKFIYVNNKATALDPTVDNGILRSSNEGESGPEAPTDWSEVELATAWTAADLISRDVSLSEAFAFTIHIVGYVAFVIINSLEPET